MLHQSMNNPSKGMPASEMTGCIVFVSRHQSDACTAIQAWNNKSLITVCKLVGRYTYMLSMQDRNIVCLQHGHSLLPCSCIRKFGASTQRAWLWLDVLSDLLFLVDLCTLLLSAFYTDRAANVIVASQTACVEAGQHSQTCLGHQHTAFDRKLSKLNLAAPAEAGGTLKRDLARSMSRGKSKRDVTLMQGPNGGMG